jgi:putative spermidine/putrescine transport system ATP-binding protein
MSTRPQHSSPGAALELVGVTKRYGEDPAVDDVSLRIEAGEFLTLLGPSGSGKTTTLNMIAGFTDVTAGQILLDGRPIAKLPPHRRDIGMVFQSYALFPHMSAFDNVAFPLRQRDVKREQIASRVQEALELVQMGDYGKRYPRQLSGGQQQRIAVARAIVFNPRVLLMDEPLGALDKKLRESLQLEIKRIHSELGITFVYVTHDQEEALVLSDRIAIFNGGRIEQAGASSELYERPRSVFVADFIGESNLFSGPVVRNGDGFALDRGATPIGLPPFDGLEEGQAVIMVVRPERLNLVEPNGGPPQPDWNAQSGTVADVIYLGNTHRYVVSCGDARLVVREQVGQAARRFGPGDQVIVTWPVDAGVVLRSESAESA